MTEKIGAGENRAVDPFRILAVGAREDIGPRRIGAARRAGEASGENRCRQRSAPAASPGISLGAAPRAALKIPRCSS
jgi:hypothetical protein